MVEAAGGRSSIGSAEVAVVKELQLPELYITGRRNLKPLHTVHQLDQLWTCIIIGKIKKMGSLFLYLDITYEYVNRWYKHDKMKFGGNNEI
jgi:hypothetical protein